ATDLVKTYGSGDTAVRALDGVSVGFAAGEFTAIMGPSGSGKSTLMHCLAGLDTPASGSVRIGGTEISGLGDRALTLLRRRRVGFIFPVLQPAAALDRRAEHPASAGTGRSQAGPRMVGYGHRFAGPGGPAAAPAEPAVRRSAATGGLRPRARRTWT